MLTSLHGVSQRPTWLHSVGYTIPKKYLLQVEIWFRGFSWPPGGCQESLPPHPGHKAQRGRQERSRGQNDYPCISFVPLPSPRPLQVSPAQPLYLVPAMTQPFSILFTPEEGVLQLFIPNTFSFPVFFSLFSFPSPLDLFFLFPSL